jgi:hypothetical protein
MKLAIEYERFGNHHIGHRLVKGSVSEDLLNNDKELVYFVYTAQAMTAFNTLVDGYEGDVEQARQHMIGYVNDMAKGMKEYQRRMGYTK